jgi:hypothetical protein
MIDNKTYAQILWIGQWCPFWELNLKRRLGFNSLSKMKLIYRQQASHNKK